MNEADDVQSVPLVRCTELTEFVANTKVASGDFIGLFLKFCSKGLRLPNSILPDRCCNLGPVFVVVVATGSLTAIAANARINSIIPTFNSLVELGCAAALRFAGMCNRLASRG